MTPEEIIDTLGMTSHPEGGWYAETYRSDGSIAAAALPSTYRGARAWSTAIYFLLAGDEVSRLHRVASDEVLHLYAGDAVEVLVLHPGGHGDVSTLGLDLGAGARPQVVVTAHSWFGFRIPARGWSLIGATVAPGFDWDDFEIGDRSALSAAYPDFADFIAALTP